MTVKNRIFIPGHNTALSVKGLVSDEMIAYHEARAAVRRRHDHHGSEHGPSELRALRPAIRRGTDDCIPGIKRMAEMGRRHDCRVLGPTVPSRARGGGLGGRLRHGLLRAVRGAGRVLQEHPHATDDGPDLGDHRSLPQRARREWRRAASTGSS